jgi:hypothetical protein
MHRIWKGSENKLKGRVGPLLVRLPFIFLLLAFCAETTSNVYNKNCFRRAFSKRERALR